MANPSIEFTKVLIHPLGLTGYALFLIFGILARGIRRNERRWILPAALVAAGVTLLGGLGLAYRDVGRQAENKVTTLPTPSPTQVGQQSRNSSPTGKLEIKGNNNTVVKDVNAGGDVTINVGQSSGQVQTTKFPPPER